MSLRFICRAGQYARHGDQHGRSKATDPGADQGIFGRNIGVVFRVPKVSAISLSRFIERVLKRFGYVPHGRVDKGVLLRYIERMTRLSRQQVTRLVRQYRKDGKTLLCVTVLIQKPFPHFHLFVFCR